MSKEITEEDIRRIGEKILKDFPKMGLLTKEEVDVKRRILGNFAIDGLGKEIYQLPGGGLTGKGGWNMFIKELEKQGKKYIDERKNV